MLKRFLSLWKMLPVHKSEISYALISGDVIQESGKVTRRMFALADIDWWRRDEPQELTVIALRDGRKLLIKDATGNLAHLLNRAT